MASDTTPNLRNARYDAAVPKVVVGNGHVLCAKGVADITAGSVTLNNVLLVPEIQSNLISVSQALDSGLDEISFTEHRVTMLKNGIPVASGTRTGNLFRLDSGTTQQLNQTRTVSQIPSAPSALWHNRLGHLAPRTIKLLHDSGVIKATGLIATEPCRACALGKMTRRPFRSGASIPKAVRFGYLNHSDVCTWGCTGIDDSEYFVTFIDDFFRFVAVYPIANKSDVLSKFKEFVSVLQTETGLSRPVVRLLSDNGVEYTGQEFKQFCCMMGIQHTTSCAYTPQQNGVAERGNRTLLEGARSMLATFDLPSKWWPYAICYAAYVRNRSPSQSLHGKSPFEIRHGQLPNLSKVRVFGCQAFLHIPDALRRKCNYKALACHFLGVAADQNGFIVCLDDGRIKVSRDVNRFQEERGPAHQEPDNIVITKPPEAHHRSASKLRRTRE